MNRRVVSRTIPHRYEWNMYIKSHCHAGLLLRSASGIRFSWYSDSQP